MLKIHLFHSNSTYLLWKPATSCSLSTRERIQWVRFWSLLFKQFYVPYLLVKVARFPLGTICSLEWGHHTRCHDANNWLIHSPMDGFWGFSFFFSIVNRTVMNKFFELKLAKVNFCYLQLQNTNWSMWEYRKFSIVKHHCL